MKEGESHFNEWLAQLSDTDRRAVELWRAGKKPHEIAAELGMRPRRVYYLLHALAERLREEE